MEHTAYFESGNDRAHRATTQSNMRRIIRDAMIIVALADVLIPRVGIVPFVRTMFLIAAAIPVYYATRIIYAAREGARWSLRSGLIYCFTQISWTIIAFLCVAVLYYSRKVHGIPPDADFPHERLLILLITPIILTELTYPFLKPKKRSRHIPLKVRRRVIERDLGREPYDPKQYHLDHILPVAKLGSHTEDNLRVLPRKANLKKGKKMPRLPFSRNLLILLRR